MLNRVLRERMIRKTKLTTTGYNIGDLDVAFQLFRCGLVQDGNLTSKSSKAHFIKNGYAAHYKGVTALTGLGTLHFLTTFAVYRYAFKFWRHWKRHPFVPDEYEVDRALH